MVVNKKGSYDQNIAKDQAVSHNSSIRCINMLIKN